MDRVCVCVCHAGATLLQFILCTVPPFVGHSSRLDCCLCVRCVRQVLYAQANTVALLLEEVKRLRADNSRVVSIVEELLAPDAAVKQHDGPLGVAAANAFCRTLCDHSECMGWLFTWVSGALHQHPILFSPRPGRPRSQHTRSRARTLCVGC